MSMPTTAESLAKFNAMPPEVSHGSGVTNPDTLPAQEPVVSRYDGDYPAYLTTHLTHEQLLATARDWGKDAAARIPVRVAAYERANQDRDPLAASKAARLILGDVIEVTGSPAEARIWAQRTIGPLSGDTSFDAVQGSEQEQVSAQFETVQIDLAPYLKPLQPVENE